MLKTKCSQDLECHACLPHGTVVGLQSASVTFPVIHTF